MEETFIMTYDQTTGEITGFYPQSTLAQYGEIPTPNIEITAEKHSFYMEHNGQYRLNLQTLEDELIPIPEPVPQLPTQDERLSALESAMSAMMGV